MKSIATPRDRAVRSVARNVLRIDFNLEPAGAVQEILVSELRQALEQVYELGAGRPSLRSIAGGASPAARADAAEAKVRELESRNAAMLQLANDRVREATRLEVRMLELEAYVKQLEGR